MILFKKIIYWYWRYVVSPKRYAQHLGVKIGKDCFISTREWSTEAYLVTIGNHVQITRGVAIHNHGGCNAIRKQIPDFDIFGKVVIEDWAYIGAFSQIMPGVTIGAGSIVAAGSIVTKSVEPNTVVGGNPAKFICTTDEYLNRNLKYNVKAHTGKTNKLSQEKKKHYLMSLPDTYFIHK